MRKKAEGKMELVEQMKVRHQELVAEKEQIDKELKAVEAYLSAIGALEKKRGRKRKSE